MCAIVGALIWAFNKETNPFLNSVFSASVARGRDGRGWAINAYYAGAPTGSREQTAQRFTHRSETFDTLVEFPDEADFGTLIGNLRAEPTTEYVARKSDHDQQPYRVGKWVIVHNGTVANDKALRDNSHPSEIDSAAIAEILNRSDYVAGASSQERMHQFVDCMKKLKGSFAILATHDDHPDIVFAHCNYRPIWYVKRPDGLFFASARDYLDDYAGNGVTMQEPYSTYAYTLDGARCLDMRMHSDAKVLVVCSGGLDSTVAAKLAIDSGAHVELLHFGYGSRAEGPESEAIAEIGKALGVAVNYVPMRIYDPSDSPLLQKDSTIAGGEEGAEFAHEWVPARNLVMLALATAFAEARGFDAIALGNNLEEAGAYPDNEPEFINRFNDLLPFAVGDGKKIRVVMPVGNLMKHEIVKVGLEIGAPLHLTWSCYRAGDLHCGTCGPCFMRRTAFKINCADEVITYACEEA